MVSDEMHDLSSAARHDRALPELQRQAMAKIVEVASRCITCGTAGHDPDYHDSTLVIDPKMRPVLTAVLAEVAEQEETGGLRYAPHSYEWNVMKAATYIRQALRLKSGGAT